MISKKISHILPILLGFFFCFMVSAGFLFAKDTSKAAETLRDLNLQIVAANGNHDLSGALRAAEKAARVAKVEYGESSLEAANAMNNLGNLYAFADWASEAEQLFKKAILIYLEKSDMNGTGMADIYFNLGVAYAMQKKYKDAINILNKALVIRHEKLGPDNAATKKTEQMINELTKLTYPKTEKI